MPEANDTTLQMRSFFDETGMSANAPPRSILDIELDPIRASAQEKILQQMENLTVGPPSRDELVVCGTTALFNRHIGDIERHAHDSNILYAHRYYR